MEEDTEINSIIAPYKKEMDCRMDEKISHTSMDLDKNGDNSTLGNLLADYTYAAAREWAKKNNIPSVDAAVINIGSIRSTIGRGDILLRHIYEVMPFENQLVIVKFKGKDIQGLFDYYAKTKKNNPISHLVISVEKGKITKALIDGKPIDESRDYYIATNDYLALGGDNMWFFGKGEIIDTNEKLRDIFIREFKKHPEVVPPTAIRLTFIK
ncbi:5'-nucleotidase, C-terminal domain [Riemerella columbipharyngis]|uniref:5'-nucleotidase, C-terminal domain n=2 Tax=Riemerella columbipharyngis TaxID=1071918 RepID=A0A1G6YGM8_9FLAO|nr:5'-nucleotidase, C-terminal domain [Riemerella columbipharyngis]